MQIPDSDKKMIDQISKNIHEELERKQIPPNIALCAIIQSVIMILIQNKTTVIESNIFFEKIKQTYANMMKIIEGDPNKSSEPGTTLWG